MGFQSLCKSVECLVLEQEITFSEQDLLSTTARCIENERSSIAADDLDSGVYGVPTIFCDTHIQRDTVIPSTALRFTHGAALGLGST